MTQAKPQKYGPWLRKFSKSPQWPKRMTVIMLVWEDAAHSEDDDNASTVLSFLTGTVIHADSKCIKIAFETFEDKSVRDVTTVPAGMVREIAPLGHMDFPVP